MTTDKTPATLATVKHGGCVQLAASERARFEAWADDRGLDTTKFSDNGMEDSYDDLNTGQFWDAWLSALSAQPSPGGQGETFPWENFPAYLIDKCEGDTISEEGLQQAVAAMAKDERYSIAARQPVGELSLPPDGYYKIVYDDAQVPDESFARTGSLDAALRRFEQISERWNAHLFVRFANNTRDCTVPNATPAQAVDLGMQQDAARWRAIAPHLSVEWDEDEMLKRWTWIDFKGDALSVPTRTRESYASVEEAIDAVIDSQAVGNG